MATQRPGRPTSRAGQPVRPATAPLPKQSAPPATARGRAAGSSTRSVQKQGSSRPVPKMAPNSNSTMMIGIGAGVVVLLGIGAFFMMGGESEKHATPAVKETSKPKAVDVRGMETEGMKKCDEGLALIKKNEAQLGNRSMSEGQKAALKADLEKGKKLISDGMGLLTQANEKSGNKYDITQYQEALITVRKKLMELRD